MTNRRKPVIEHGTLIDGGDRWYVADARVGPDYACPHSTKEALREPSGNPYRLLPLVYLRGEDGAERPKGLVCVPCEFAARDKILDAVWALLKEHEGSCDGDDQWWVARIKECMPASAWLPCGHPKINEILIVPVDGLPFFSCSICKQKIGVA